MPNKKKKHKDKKQKMAQTADRHRLYEKSVQDPKAEIDFFDMVFKKHRGRKALSFREDFCGTAYLSTTWVKSHKKRTAVSVDIHKPTLDWAFENHVQPEKKSVQERVTLVNANVLDVKEPKVDVGCALNFSYCVFKQRKELLDYFKVAHASLVDDGLFFCELFGGTEAIVELEERRELPGFTYVWEQAKYNPITNEILCHIHFEFPDGSRMKKAFTYDWRLWTVPEVRECLYEAGFKRVEIWWDPVEDDEKDDYYRVTEEEENQEGWLVYIVGIK